MVMSTIGQKMAGMSGLRSIMEDIATAMAGAQAGQWLNLSIGNPAPIPEVIATWQQLIGTALASDFARASCQYGPSRGSPELVAAVADYFSDRYGWAIGSQNIIVGPGSQMLCFIAAAVFTGAGDAGLTRLILPMQPDYTGYDSMSMIPGGVAGIWPRIEHGSHRYFRYGFDFPALERRDDIGLMLASSPSNPTGRCADAVELASLTRIAERRDVPLIVDHAYGEPFPKIGQTLVPPAWHPNVINCFSLSKAGLPGERIGIAIGPERYISAMVSFLSNACVCSSRLAQAAVAAGLRSGRLDELVSSVITPFYAGRRTLGESLLHQFMPGDVSWRVHTSRGGMFCWVWVDEDWFDDLRLYRLLKTRHVFITPGRSFFVEPESQSDLGSHARRCVRISLTTDEATLIEGMKRIGDAVSELRAISDTTRRG